MYSYYLKNIWWDVRYIIEKSVLFEILNEINNESIVNKFLNFGKGVY